MVKKVAVILTEYRECSHADMIIGRLLGEHGYPPKVSIVSMYTDQVPVNDMSRAMCARHNIPIFSTIGEAVSIGAPDDAVDGIVIIGEHGDYPWNEKQQKLYPRRRFMEEVLQAMDRHRMRVPIFLDKHYACKNEDAVWIYDQVMQRGLPFFAGSSLPFTEQVPAYDPIELHEPDIIFSITSGGHEVYGYHAVEVLQSLAERREGGRNGNRRCAGIGWCECVESDGSRRMAGVAIVIRFICARDGWRRASAHRLCGARFV